MKKKNRYYVHMQNGRPTRVARLGDDGAFGWENGKWELMSGLWSIENDITNYEPISEEEANELIAGGKV